MPKEPRIAETEVMTGDEAKGILAIHERREAMDAALDIAATQTKLQAQEAVKQAKKVREKAAAAYQKAAKKAETALDEAGLELLTNHPLTQDIITMVKTLSGVEITAEYAWQWEGVTYVRAKEGGGTFNVRACSALDFEIRMEDDEGETVTTARNKTITLPLDINEYEGLPELVAERDEASEALNQAGDVLDQATERLNNHSAQVDVARIQLQRGKLQDMGHMGIQALEMVDKVIAASEGNNYLELL